jgi:protein-S-isoprenylcysteine O-methyltransferase Ste14
MADPAWFRAAILLGPALAVGLIMVWRPPTGREATGVLLSFLWLFGTLALANAVAPVLGWWRFAPTSEGFLGTPLDVLLGWSIFWGPFVFLIAKGRHLLVVTGLLLLIDVLAMPRLGPLVVLDDNWLIGEAIVLGFALLPAQILARLTAEDQWVGWRVVLQAIGYGVLIMFVVPAASLEWSGRSALELWQVATTRGDLAILLLAPPVILGLAAVQAFAEQGRGTAIPFDPPKHLVVSGPYAYLANPMQVSTILIWIVLACLLASPLLFLVAGLGVIFMITLVPWHQKTDIAERFGDPWRDYRHATGNWWPRWRPYVPQPAKLYVAEGCGYCQEAARLILPHDPTGLEIVAAEDHPTRDLEAVTYRFPQSDREVKGAMAVACAFEHVNLAFGFLGWALQLPIVRNLVLVLFDAVVEKPMDRCYRRSEPL